MAVPEPRGHQEKLTDVSSKPEREGEKGPNPLLPAAPPDDQTHWRPTDARVWKTPSEASLCHTKQSRGGRNHGSEDPLLSASKMICPGDQFYSGLLI
jgi:hypothetical protein